MNDEKLVIGISKQFDDGSQPHLSRLLEGYNVEFKEFKTSLEIIKSLINGDLDLAGLSGLSAFDLGFSGNSSVSGLEISTFLPRREPTLIMVCKDKITHLPRNGNIFVDCELVRRQLKRFRPDLNVFGKNDFELGELELAPCLEKLAELFEEQALDGYVLERSEWNTYVKKGRRHTLGMQIENDESKHRFVPPPLRGFSLLISRIGFPQTIFEELNDEQSMLSFNVESKLFLELNKDPLLGLNVSIRKVSTIARSLNEEGGLISDIIFEKLINLQKTEELTDSIKMVEVLMERLNKNGNKTFSLEKKYLPDDDEFRILKIMVDEWENMMNLTSEES
ncbi:MAG: hypothetical protein CMB48_01095 [Euryarchaeota archaeon]|nr:hypothetical protein [Euryarchaeota archaeon]|tara:strand:+ start:6005 stop:7012 length:1008 start_codon:yes stop_codon:yes gene_type:complete